MLTKHRTVLNRAALMLGIVGFAQTEGGATAIAVSEDAWRDMGSPEQITITIEPGDQLNKDEETAKKVKAGMAPAEILALFKADNPDIGPEFDGPLTSAFAGFLGALPPDHPIKEQ